MYGARMRTPETSLSTGMSIATILDRFVDGFNVSDLDQVMSHFAEDAIYCPGDGRTHRGKGAIREAFRPQFEGAFGDMFFAVDDRVVDEVARKAAIRWICHHDISNGKGRALSWPMRWLYRFLYGSRFGWYGTDVFHFDEQGLIKAKHTYGNYGPRPQIRRDLGRPR